MEEDSDTDDPVEDEEPEKAGGASGEQETEEEADVNGETRNMLLNSSSM
jgi:hypothetical protein